MNHYEEPLEAAGGQASGGALGRRAPGSQRPMTVRRSENPSNSNDFTMEPPRGFEPRTYALRARGIQTAAPDLFTVYEGSGSLRPIQTHPDRRGKGNERATVNAWRYRSAAAPERLSARPESS
jgi:hypothetical protein